MTVALIWAQFEFTTPGRVGWTVLLLAVWLVAVAGVVFVVVRMMSARSPGLSDVRQGRPVLAVLRERYRRGDIDRDMYRGVVEGLGTREEGEERRWRAG